MSRDRATLMAELISAMRENAGRGLLLHQAIAEHFGLGPTDLKCLDLVRNEEELTAGRLAEVTGMSSSAITSALDRLERAGFVERVRGVEDRRKVFVRSTGRHEAAVNAVFARVAAAFDAVLDDYDDAVLEIILGFVGRLNVTAHELTSHLSEVLEA